ncbi:MAG: diacylglycerol kinase family lipid kinase [Clostridia bacterium]|nr:diacylglycerol kinase family lipid kinase [Clostridia bacterium]
MRKAFVIVNPKAGKTRSKTMLFDIVEELCKNSYTVNCAISLYPGHAKELAQNAANEGYDLIVVSGGDGTLNEVTEGVFKSGKKTPIGYIPSGSTNDFALSAGISSNPKTAINDIVSGNDYLMDIGKFGDRYFNYIASFGAFTSVSYKTPQASKNALGHLAYIIEGIKDIGSITPCHIKMEADGKVYEGDYSFGAIGNSTSIGGLIKLKEELVSLCDGVFEVILIKQPQNPVELSTIIHGLTFSDFQDPMFEFFKASKIKITTDASFDWTLDGEFEKGKKEIEVSNINKAYILRKR